VSKTRGIRLSDKEDQIIEEFLQQNSFLDFSTLARMAILSFVKEPRITLKAVSKVPNQEEGKRNGRPQH